MPGLHNFFNSFSRHPDKKDPEGNTALYNAAKAGNINKVKDLLKHGADPNVCSEHHLTPLHSAAYWGEVEIVELLLKHGAKVDIDNGKGWTALHSAAVSGGLKTRKKIIGLLLNKGADPEKADKNGWTSIDYMMLWEENVGAAERLKQFLGTLTGLSRLPPDPKKPSKVNTPKH